MTDADPRQVKAFEVLLWGPLVAICSRLGLDPKRAMAEAAEASNFGKYAIGNNYWNLQGRGSNGMHKLITVDRVASNEGGGYVPNIETFAVFKSLDDAIVAYCQSRST